MEKELLLLITVISIFSVLGCTFYETGVFRPLSSNESGETGQVHIVPIPTGNGTTNESEFPYEQGNQSGDYHNCFIISNFQYDAQGDDNVNLNDEYVTMQNLCNENINITGWRITDAGRNFYEFPEFVLPALSVFILHSGCGTDSSWHLYWCSDAEVWDNTGDTLYMSNSYGAMQYNYSY